MLEFVKKIILNNDEKLIEDLKINKYYELVQDTINIFKEEPKTLTNTLFLNHLIHFLDTLQSTFNIYNIEIFKSIVNLVAGNYDKCGPLIKKLSHHSRNTAEIFKDTMKSTNLQEIFEQTRLPRFGSKSERLEWKEIMQKVKEGRVSSTEFFNLCDMNGNGNGLIDKSEFATLSLRLGNNLSEHRINEIFCEVKKSQNKTNMELNLEEFEKAIGYLTNKNIVMSLEDIGIDIGWLSVTLIYLLGLLLILFVFIYFGIQAFSLGGVFGAVINSIIPAGVGAGVGNSGKTYVQVPNEETVKNTALKTNKVLTSKAI
eukprot:TRINITY_DN5298_c0_g1_i3.p1 TRINITY_DN5298_c0_g1~~TRINITY_DN5298_c0_g1_i3.p1  ORF type:complete len:314 (+),score=36.93 TRINITY_DN5298_c0_g1_i3:1-942(+)